MPDVFISYSHKDLDFARKIDRTLARVGIDVWRDERILPGLRFDDEIREQLRSSKVCLFLISSAFLSSSYCQNEVGFAEANEIAFLPCLLHHCELTGFLASRQYVRLLGVSNGKLQRRKLVHEVIRSLTFVRKENLRLELLEFYKRQEQLSRQDQSSELLNASVGCVSSSEATVVRQSIKNSAHLLSTVVNRLESGESIESLFLGLPPHRREYSITLPGWHIQAPSLTGLGAKTEFPPAPDFIFHDHVFDRDKVIEGWVAFLREDHPRIYGHCFPLLPKLAFRSLYDKEWLSTIGWSDPDDSRGELVLLPGKGIYQVALVTESFGRTNVVFTKYLSIEATRIKLRLGSSNVGRLKSRGVRADSQETLELMYQGCYNEQLSFLLYNNKKSIALVQSIEVVVHNFTPRPPEPPLMGALVIEHRYEVTLRPEICRISVTKENFKYSAGDVDKFTIGLNSESPGYNYQVSLIVEWVDIDNGKLRIIETPREMVRFPLFSDRHLLPKS